jgi:hypothetical protein
MILKKPLIVEIFLSALLVAFLHKVALSLFLYWTTSWFDILMHFLGGLVIGLIAAFVFFIYPSGRLGSGFVSIPKDHKGSAFLIVIGSVLVVALTWELWELFVGFTDVLDDQADTILDVIMGLIGGTTAFLYAKSKIWQK